MEQVLNTAGIIIAVIGLVAMVAGAITATHLDQQHRNSTAEQDTQTADNTTTGQQPAN